MSTRELVTIGQQWERRTRKREKPVIVIRQVYRKDRECKAEWPGNEIGLISFNDLRKHYTLLP
jgi:hypothetical protein